MQNGDIVWVMCPYCRKGESCKWENGFYICPSKNRPFTEQQSVEASHP